MNLQEAFLKRWLHVFVFGMWMVVLVYLLRSQRYIDFLRPEFGWLLVPAIFIAMGFMIAALAGNRHPKADFSTALRAAVLLLPLVYLVALPDAMLGGLDFKNRFVGTGSLGLVPSEPSKDALPHENGPKGVVAPFTEDGPAVSASPTECTISDLYRNSDRYNGRQVVFTGMIMRDEELKSYFGGRDTAVYRFLITCCAADALPLAIAVDSDRSADFAKDQWVRVAGIFSLLRMDGKPVPLVIDADIKPTKAPAFPYLF